MCTKVSICFFLLRLPTSKYWIRPLQAGIAFLITTNIVLTFIWIFQCSPVQLAWKANVQGHCFSRHFLLGLILTQAVISIISDFSLALFPIGIIKNLHMRTRQKVGICLLMGLGVITGSCCVVRTVLNGGALPLDATYGGITNWFWRQFEVQLGILAACIPTLLPAYRWVKEKLLSSLHSEKQTFVTVEPANPGDVTAVDPSVAAPEVDYRQPYNTAQSTDSPSSQNEKASPGHGHDRSSRSSRFGSHRQEASTDSQRSREHSSSQHGSLRTFFDDDAEDQLVTRPERAVQPTNGATRRSKAVSFSRRDLHSQSPLRAVKGNASNEETPHVLVTVPSGESQHVQHWGSSEPQQMVRATEDPQQSLQFTQMQPRFERNRGTFARILDLNRRSWQSWISNRSSMRGPDSAEMSDV